MISDGTEHKESLDHFSSYLKGRLENHQIPVDPEGWNKISGHLKRRKRIRLGWISTGIAAAVLLAILWLSIPFEMDTVQEQIVEQERPFQHEEDIPVPQTTEPVIETQTPAIQTPATAPILSFAAKIKEPAEEIEEEIVESNIPQEENELPEENERQAGVREQPQRPKSESFIPSGQEPFDFAELPRKKKSGKWLLAVAMGTGGGDASIDFLPQKESPLLNDYVSPSNIYYSQMFAGKDNNLYQNKEYVDISHAIPLSAGITVRKDISPFFAVESGLLYTYLSSELKKNRVSKNDKLQLHYLGVPLNLVGYIVNKPRWNMYVSGGVMLEKGLKSVLTRREYASNEIISTTEKNSIPGVQFSLNGSIGIAYRLIDHWSLYAEPKLYYYFDTDQPPSTRTEHPFGFGVNGGIRYHF